MIGFIGAYMHIDVEIKQTHKKASLRWLLHQVTLTAIDYTAVWKITSDAFFV